MANLPRSRAPWCVLRGTKRLDEAGIPRGSLQDCHDWFFGGPEPGTVLILLRSEQQVALQAEKAGKVFSRDDGSGLTWLLVELGNRFNGKRLRLAEWVVSRVQIQRES